MKFFWISGAFFGIVFTVLLSIRLDLLNKIFPASANTPPAPISTGVERDTWMNVSQSGRKIGYSHTRFTKKEKGYRLHETLFMRINTMDMIHDINLSTEGLLNSDFTRPHLTSSSARACFALAPKGLFQEMFFQLQRKAPEVLKHSTFRSKINPIWRPG